MSLATEMFAGSVEKAACMMLHLESLKTPTTQPAISCPPKRAALPVALLSKLKVAGEARAQTSKVPAPRVSCTPTRRQAVGRDLAAKAREVVAMEEERAPRNPPCAALAVEEAATVVVVARLVVVGAGARLDWGPAVMVVFALEVTCSTPVGAQALVLEFNGLVVGACEVVPFGKPASMKWTRAAIRSDA